MDLCALQLTCSCPSIFSFQRSPWPGAAVETVVGLGGIEPPTSPLSGVRSSQLSYRPGSLTWWSWSGSNRRPPECKSGALPAELQPQNLGAGLASRPRFSIEASWMQRPWVQPMAAWEKLSSSKWRSVASSLPSPKPGQRFGSGTTVHY